MGRPTCVLLVVVAVQLASPASAQERAAELSAPLPRDRRPTVSAPAAPEGPAADADEVASPLTPSRAGRRAGAALLATGISLAVITPVAATVRANNLLDQPEVLLYRRRVPMTENNVCRPARAGEPYGVSADVLAEVVDTCDRVDTLERLRWSMLTVGIIAAGVGLVLILVQRQAAGSPERALWLSPSLGRNAGGVALAGRF